MIDDGWMDETRRNTTYFTITDYDNRSSPFRHTMIDKI